jgi:hypothetical protein
MRPFSFAHIKTERCRSIPVVLTGCNNQKEKHRKGLFLSSIACSSVHGFRLVYGLNPFTMQR